MLILIITMALLQLSQHYLMLDNVLILHLNENKRKMDVQMYLLQLMFHIPNNIIIIHL